MEGPTVPEDSSFEAMDLFSNFQDTLSGSLSSFLRGGMNAFSNAAHLRVCSAPRLVMGDYEDTVQEMLMEEEREGRQLRWGGPQHFKRTFKLFWTWEMREVTRKKEMWDKTKPRLAAAASSGGDDHECCVPVVDSNTFIFTIGGAAVAVYFLRFVIINH